MGLPSFGFGNDYSTIVLSAGALVIIAVHVLPYLVDTRGIRTIPGPWFAKFTDAWLGRVAARGHRSEVVHKLHKQGTFVRLAPNHVSIADPDALQTVYAHGNGSLKSNFYDAFVSIHRGVFNTRDRADHGRKRKIISHIFSLKSVLEFEPYIRLHLGELLEQWDKLVEGGKKGLSGKEGEGWFGKDEWVWFDCLPWYNYLAFDVIGDLSFGSPFGMVKAAKDIAPVARSQTDAMATYGNDKAEVDVEYFPAVRILNERGDYSASMGVLPPWVRPLLKKFHPWYRKGCTSTANLAGLAIAAVSKRLRTPTDRVDLLSKLQQGKDDEGKPMGRPELTAEALTQLIAGSDTTSNSSCAITYYLALNPKAQSKLQEELDEALGHEDDPIASSEIVKRLPYLEASINEALRLHSPSAIGLPRIVPEGGLHVSGKFFPEGTVLSVPSYTIHRDPETWGNDVEAYRPERWFEQDQVGIQKTFNPFSYGPRACVGKNLANLELQIFIATIFRRYTFVLENPGKHFDTLEGFLRKPVSCRVGMKRREV
ncbi:cytochrome P450 monooxygenase pc-bph [Thelephora ganbajun]|uniref:Cytochrome P450 monooxygenase pc-bph n=1 Tax=Thelephora ganbajun TaxID=370292 RepID=A0ACB6ZJI4_THEGA|nr:cytochrome P450 monooxygenase pc-bph [Thelephora ganbajun]